MTDTSDSFSIDQVRDLFAADVEAAVASLDRALSEPLIPGEASRERLREAAVSLHSIKGVASLVGLHLMSEVCRQLERLLDVLDSYVQAGAPEVHLLLAFLRRSGEVLRALLKAALAGDAQGLGEIAGRWEGEARVGWGEWLETPPSYDPEGLSETEEGELSGEELLGDVFRAELMEYQPEVDATAGGLLSHVGDTTRWERLRRVFHRLKGSSAVVGEDELSGLFKVLEHQTAAVSRGEQEPSLGLARELLNQLASLLNRAGGPALILPPPPREEPTPAEGGSQDAALLEAFLDDLDEVCGNLEAALLMMEHSPQSEEQARTAARHLHTLKGAAASVGLAELAQLLHRAEDVLAQVELHPEFGARRSQLMQALLQVSDRLKSQAVELESGPGQSEARSRLLAQNLSTLLEQRSTQVAGSDEVVPPSSVAELEAEEEFERPYVRVETQRLDSLLNMVGELIVSRTSLEEKLTDINTLRDTLAQAERRLRRTLGEFQDRFEYSAMTSGQRELKQEGGALEGFSDVEFDKYDDFNILTRSMVEMVDDVGEVVSQIHGVLSGFESETVRFRRVTGRLQSDLMEARMVPIGTVLRRLLRPVRDAARREHKQVITRLSGENVAIDKNLVDRIFRPLLHVVRNAVVHGIESPAERANLGKSPAGRVTLLARYQANSVVLEISDDGRGLDFAAIEARARRMGLWTQEDAPGQETLVEFLFTPGFSTRMQVDEVAGRGIGLDVLRQALGELKGSVSVSTQPGEGTTFAIRLPLTLAISQTMPVRVGEFTYALPIDFVESCGSIRPDSVVHSGQRRFLRVQGGLVPLVELRVVLGLPLPAQARGVVGAVAILLKVGDQRFALQVDAVYARREIVIKSLSKYLEPHPLFSGATITGSGGVMPLLDVQGVLGMKGHYNIPATLTSQQTATSPAPLPPTPVPLPTRVEAWPQAQPATPLPAPATPMVAEKVYPSTVPETAPTVRKVRRDVVPQQQIKALVVDDAISVRRVGSMYLKALGCEVETAVDGLDALRLLREKSFDVVFTDLEMPRVHGFELIAEIKQKPQTAHIPVVVITSRSGEKHQQRATTLGASGYLVKPFTRDMLSEQLQAHTSWRRGGTS